MQYPLRPVRRGSVKLLPSIFQQRAALNRRYMLSLRTENLLQNHYMEAGLWGPRYVVGDIHGGWESPTCQLRGHFLGHWLSAAAMFAAATGDQEIKGKADYIISELARCQQENGGEWVGSIPEKYLEWVARGKRVWAPHYTLHKTLMGLWDMYAIGGNQHPDTGMIAYFLPLHAGAEKIWGTPTDDFWCCHGSLVQAHTMYADNLWFEHWRGDYRTRGQVHDICLIPLHEVRNEAYTVYFAMGDSEA